MKTLCHAFIGRIRSAGSDGYKSEFGVDRVCIANLVKYQEGVESYRILGSIPYNFGKPTDFNHLAFEFHENYFKRIRTELQRPIQLGLVTAKDERHLLAPSINLENFPFSYILYEDKRRGGVRVLGSLNPEVQGAFIDSMYNKDSIQNALSKESIAEALVKSDGRRLYSHSFPADEFPNVTDVEFKEGIIF